MCPLWRSWRWATLTRAPPAPTTAPLPPRRSGRRATPRVRGVAGRQRCVRDGCPRHARPTAMPHGARPSSIPLPQPGPRRWPGRCSPCCSPRPPSIPPARTRSQAQGAGQGGARVQRAHAPAHLRRLRHPGPLRHGWVGGARGAAGWGGAVCAERCEPATVAGRVHGPPCHGPGAVGASGAGAPAPLRPRKGPACPRRSPARPRAPPPADRADKVRALVTGPEDTPYYGGCFIFDVYFPGEARGSVCCKRLVLREVGGEGTPCCGVGGWLNRKWVARKRPATASAGGSTRSGRCGDALLWRPLHLRRVLPGWVGGGLPRSTTNAGAR